jgi:hypothetical protein
VKAGARKSGQNGRHAWERAKVSETPACLGRRFWLAEGASQKPSNCPERSE